MESIHRRTIVALAILSLFALAHRAAAGVGIWTPLGPDGGSVWALAVDPDDENAVYAGTVNGVFKSSDAGETWASASRGLGPIGQWVWALAATSEAVYAGTNGNGAYKSTDGGATWVHASAGLPVTNNYTNVLSLLADPRSPDRVWAGTHQGVFVTANGGQTWQSRRRGLPLDVPVGGLAMTPDGKTLYAANQHGVFKTTDQGKSWIRTSKGLPVDGGFGDLAVDPAQPWNVFVAGAGLWKSVNGGARWTRVAPGLFDGRVQALAWQGKRLFVSHFGGKNRGIWFSDDRGATWTAAAGAPSDQLRADIAAGPDLVYTGIRGEIEVGGVFRSLDRGRHWDLSSHGLNGLEARGVAVDPSNPDVLYAAVDQFGVFKSTDRGATWERLDLGPDFRRIRIDAVLVDPSDPATVHAGSSDALGWLFRSRDAGATWERIGPPRIEIQVEVLAADPGMPGAVWAAGTPNLFHWDGAAWEQVSIPDAVTVRFLAFQVDPRDPDILWAAGTYAEFGPVSGLKYHLRLLRSGDGGQTWERRETGLFGTRVNAVAVDPANSDLLLAGTDSGLFRTADAGLTWTKVAGFTAEVNAIVAAPTMPTAFYANLAGFGVQRSINNGVTWAPARRGLAPVPVNTLVVDPTDPLRLYAGSQTRGVFTWTEPASQP